MNSRLIKAIQTKAALIKTVQIKTAKPRPKNKGSWNQGITNQDSTNQRNTNQHSTIQGNTEPYKSRQHESKQLNLTSSPLRQLWNYFVKINSSLAKIRICWEKNVFVFGEITDNKTVGFYCENLKLRKLRLYPEQHPKFHSEKIYWGEMLFLFNEIRKEHFLIWINSSRTKLYDVTLRRAIRWFKLRLIIDLVLHGGEVEWMYTCKRGCIRRCMS